VVTHKSFTLPPEIAVKGYTLITVGGDQGNDGVVDSTGDNISEKNSHFCELTAAYWIWKNTNTPIKGFCHYRRYFSNPSLRYSLDNLVSIEEIEERIGARDNVVVLPERKYYDITSEELYLQCGYEKDLQITRQVIQEQYPSYLSDYDSLLRGNTGHLANMLIAPAKVYDDYCSWLFGILFEVERRTDLSGYTKAEARIFGYLSERLLDIWLNANHIHEIEYQVVNSEKDIGSAYAFKQCAMRCGLYRTAKNMLWALHRLSQKKSVRK
jgi:hypothetical protein